MNHLKTLFLCFFFFFIWKSSVFAKIELSYSTPPSELKTDEPFTIDVTVSGADQAAEYYLRGAFYKPDTTQYFGFTQTNQGGWQADPSQVTQFYKISGNGTTKISFKPDTNYSSFVTNSNYLFKIGRYTPGGSLTWSDQTPATVFIKSAEPTTTMPSSSITPSPTLAGVSITPSPTASPTPPTQTLTPGVNIDPHAIILSEVMACPNDDQGEWVELFNQTSATVSIHNWKLKDSTDTHTIDVSNTVAPYNYFIVHISSAILNNSGDSVRLFTDQSNLIDQMSYSDCKDGTSFILVNGVWQPTRSVTNGSANVFAPISTPTPSPFTPSTGMETEEQNLDTSIADDSVLIPSTIDSNPDEVFENLLIASASTEASLESEPYQIYEGTAEATITSSENKAETMKKPFLTASAAFLLGGCSYVLSAAMLAQKWYNLTSYAVTAISPSS